MKLTKFYALTLILLSIVYLSGCKAGPGKKAGFVDTANMTKDEAIPFHSAWIKEGVDKNWYDKIYIAPVDVSHLLAENSWWQNSFRYSHIEQDSEEIAEFTRETFVKAFKKAENNRFKIVKKPVAKTLVLEMAITELTPNKPFLKTAGYAPFFIGTGVKAINMTNPSVVAFEARIKDGETGEVLAKFADKEKEQTSYISKKHFSWYGHAEDIIVEWAYQFVQLANRKPGEIVKDTSTFELKPW